MREVRIGKYRHFKGDIVNVICIAKYSEALEEKVVYEYSDEVWARNKKMFLSLVDREKYLYLPQIYRFEEI